MTSNAVLLKRTMAALDLSGVALANLISSMREDGKATAPETVSRWITGASPVEPAVLGWLRELLRVKAMASRRPVMEWPEKESAVIVVANLKGGSGKTTVSRALAHVAKFDRGLKTKAFRVVAKINEHAIRERIGNVLPVDVTAEKVIGYTPAKEEVTIIDVDNIFNGDHDQIQPFFDGINPDLIVVPADFSSSLETSATRIFVDLVGDSAPIRLLHRPVFMDINFAANAAEDGFDIGSGQFVPFFIPQSVTHRVSPTSFGEEWADPNQQDYYNRLLQYLLGELGIQIEEPGDRETTIQGLSLEDLLKLLAHH